MVPPELAKRRTDLGGYPQYLCSVELSIRNISASSILEYQRYVCNNVELQIRTLFASSPRRNKHPQYCCKYCPEHALLWLTWPSPLSAWW